jgi:hypothetical protein
MLSLICGVKLNENSCEFSSSKPYRSLLSQEFEKILQESNLYKSILLIIATSDSPIELVKEKLSSKDDYFELASIGIACLQRFVQSNWTGPLKKDKISLNEILVEKLESLLSIDGETVYSTFSNLHLFFIAKLILIDFAEEFHQKIEFIDWWSMRAIYVYQQLFEERLSTLTIRVFKLIESLEEYFKENDKIGNFDKTCFYLEAGFIYYQCYNWTKGEQAFQNAVKQSSFNYELSGAFGKRTRFQVNDIAQLILKIQIDNKENKPIYESLNGDFDLKKLPKNLSHNDDTVLEKIKLKNEDDLTSINLSPIEQAIVYCIL